MILSDIQHNPLQWGWTCLSPLFMPSLLSPFHPCDSSLGLHCPTLSGCGTTEMQRWSERYWLQGEINLDWAGLRKHRGSKRQGQGWKTHLQPRGCSSEEEQLVPFWVRSARFSLLFLFFSVHHIYLDWDAVSAFRSQFHFCVLPQVHHFLCRCSFSVNKRLLPVGFWAGLSGQGNQCSPWFCLDVFCCFFGTSEMIVAYDSDSRVSILLFKGFRE